MVVILIYASAFKGAADWRELEKLYAEFFVAQTRGLSFKVSRIIFQDALMRIERAPI